MSAARDAILRLRGQGMSNRAIAAELGRNDSLISQIARGLKPGNNLSDALAALEQKRGGADVSVPVVERRKDSRGRIAKVRRKTKFAGGRTVKIKRGAVKAGAKSVRARVDEATANGDRVAFTVTFTKHARLSQSDGTPIPPDGQEQTTDVAGKGNGFPAAYWSRKFDEAGGDVEAALVQWLIDANRLAAPSPIIGIELRVWAGSTEGARRQAEGDDSRGTPVPQDPPVS